MSALQRLQEFRFQKNQAATVPASTATRTASHSSSSNSSIHNNQSSKSNHNSRNGKKSPSAIVLDSSDPGSDSESDIDLRRGVDKMSTSSPLRASPRPSTPTNPHRNAANGSGSVMRPPKQPDFTSSKGSASSSSASATQVKLPFKKLVRSFQYTGDGAMPPISTIDSALSDISSLSSLSGGSDDDVLSEDQSTSRVKDHDSAVARKLAPKRQIISSDDGSDVEEIKPRRRLVRKGDMERLSTPGDTIKRRRLIKNALISSDDENERESAPGTRSGSTTHQVSDEDIEAMDNMDRKLAQLQTTFPDTPFHDLKAVLDKSGGNFAVAAGRLVSISSSNLFDLTSETSYKKSSSTKLYPINIQQKLPKKPLMQMPSERRIRRRSTSVSDDSGDSFDEDGKVNRYRAQDLKEERALKFFNDSPQLQLQELTGCSKHQATVITGLRPFDNFDDLCVKLRKTKGVGEKVVNNYLTTTDAIHAVDAMLTTVERVREELVGILSVWCGDENQRLFENSTSSNSMEIQDKDDDDEEPGMELLDVDISNIIQTEAGRKAMHGFIRKQPRNMAPGFQLKGYQLLGINWLALLWRKKLSGILADEMGLGKTAQVIAFLAHLHETGEEGPFLIIVPSSTISNWLREFEKFCPELDVRSYYGSQAEREELREEFEEDPSYYVIVTTYNIATGNNDERKFLNRRNFKGVILDEGHMLKNCMSARYKQLMSIKSPFRLLLTGTPLQNNLEELLSLLIFIMPKIFAEHEEVLRTMFKVKVDAASERSTLLSKERIVRARHMIAPFVLRRKKIHVLKDLPKKVEKVIYCDLLPEQRVLYDRIMSSSALQAALNDSVDDVPGEGTQLDAIEMDSLDPKAQARAIKKATAGKKPTAAAKKKASTEFANILMQLRKAADHPMLFRELYKDDILKKMAKVITREIEFCDSNVAYIEEDMTVMTDFELHRLCKQYKSVNKFALPGDQWMRAGKVKELEALLPKLINKDKSRILLFSQFTMVLDILESILKTMNFKYLRMDGQSKVEERQPMIDSFNDDESFKVFLLSTKAGGFGINLTGANVVIMFDLDFNPHNDKQAEDRAHRVGQTREVEVYKLISRNTIEEQIYQLANLKLKLDQHVSQDDYAAKAMGSDTTADTGASSSSGSSTPSAGILSLIKQNWKATQSAHMDRST
ncbi:hypothetical protein BG011_010029 [Mortierella polycephala]|uniref:DNA helicase n=1 Tax=Mortierella polycephala TaxID=41804 RepID=A0A9P6TV94_9FUNG|nr:hypothetical protein BG011_010029 [Mortierella polycephala]